MGLQNYLVAVREASSEAFEAILDPYNWQRVALSDGARLYALEGRIAPETEEWNSLVIGIDCRNSTWWKYGVEEVGVPFGLRLEMTVGFVIERETYLAVRKMSLFKRAMAALERHGGLSEEPRGEYFTCQLIIDVRKYAGDSYNAMRALAYLFKRESKAFDVRYFSMSGNPRRCQGDGTWEGDLPGDDRSGIGPYAYAKAQFDDSEIIANQDEFLLNGYGWKPGVR